MDPYRFNQKLYFKRIPIWAREWSKLDLHDKSMFIEWPTKKNNVRIIFPIKVQNWFM